MSDKKEELTADNPELAKVGNEHLTAVAGGGSPGYRIIRLSYMDYTLQFLHPKPVTCPLCGEPVFGNETLDEDYFRCMHCKVMFVGYTNRERKKKGDIQLNLNKEEVLKRYNL